MWIMGISISNILYSLIKLFIFYHYDTENMSISIGNKNQALFENRYERCVIMTYFGD